MEGPGKGNRRKAWRLWPKSRALKVDNLPGTTQVHFILECGHIIEDRQRDPNWRRGITDLMDEGESVFEFACGHCHHDSPRGSVQPMTGRSAFFDSSTIRQSMLPDVE